MPISEWMFYESGLLTWGDLCMCICVHVLVWDGGQPCVTNTTQKLCFQSINPNKSSQQPELALIATEWNSLCLFTWPLLYAHLCIHAQTNTQLCRLITFPGHDRQFVRPHASMGFLGLERSRAAVRKKTRNKDRTTNRERVDWEEKRWMDSDWNTGQDVAAGTDGPFEWTFRLQAGCRAAALRRRLNQ